MQGSRDKDASAFRAPFSVFIFARLPHDLIAARIRATSSASGGKGGRDPPHTTAKGARSPHPLPALSPSYPPIISTSHPWPLSLLWFARRRLDRRNALPRNASKQKYRQARGHRRARPSLINRASLALPCRACRGVWTFVRQRENSIRLTHTPNVSHPTPDVHSLCSPSLPPPSPHSQMKDERRLFPCT